MSSEPSEPPPPGNGHVIINQHYDNERARALLKLISYVDLAVELYVLQPCGKSILL